MIEHVARTLCRVAGSRGDCACLHCDDIDPETNVVRAIGECSMWPSFEAEARAAVEAVKDHARLDKRRKPKARKPIEILVTLGK